MVNVIMGVEPWRMPSTESQHQGQRIQPLLVTHLVFPYPSLGNVAQIASENIRARCLRSLFLLYRFPLGMGEVALERRSS